jgi:hypothetical protein
LAEIFMKHGITELEWNDYVDRLAPPDVTDRIEAHLIGCLDCWDFYEQVSRASRELREAGEEARERMTLEDRQLHAMLCAVFSRIKSARSSECLDPLVKRRLSRLETVLAPFCGSKAAVCALEAAARNSPASSLEQVTAENWGAFLEKLTAIAAAMCGETFAGLVRESGQY